MLELLGGEFAAAAAVSHMPLNEGVPAALPVSRGSAATQAPKRAAALRWAVPVGALAAGLLVWVGVRETQQNKAMKSAQLEVAQNRPSVSSAPVAAAPAPKTALPDEYQSAQAKSRSLDELRRQDTTLSMTKPAGPLNKKSAAGSAAPVLSAPTLGKEKREEDAKALKDLSASMAPAPTTSLDVNNYAAQNREVPPAQNPQATPAGARGVTQMKLPTRAGR
jgi:hypothetical protein